MQEISEENQIPEVELHSTPTDETPSDNNLYINEDRVEIIEPESPLPNAEFSTLSPEFQDVLKGLGWDDLTLVQKKAIPYMRQGMDMMIQSKTGSGKTGAFLIPLIEIIEPTVAQPQALILVPTRELAIQVEKETQKLGVVKNLRSVALYGGVKYQSQIDALKNGVHLIIATPGRLIDHLQRGNVNFGCVRDLVMDEADEMLSMGFYEDMKRILRYLPKQFCATMFSATIPESVKSLSREFQSNQRQFLGIRTKDEGTNTLDHYYTVVDPLEKDQAILRLLESENPESAILFCNMKKDVAYIYDFLAARGFNVGALSGDINQAQRQKTLTAFREKKLRILIATDVAARGIDISHVTHVLIHDHPEDNEVYVHRAGRTARAGRKGKAISVVSSLEELDLKKTAQLFNIDFTKIDLPAEKDILENMSQYFVEALEQHKRKLKPIELKLAQKMNPLLDKLLEDDEHRQALNILLHDFYKTRILK